MHRTAMLLACFACAGHGRRVQSVNAASFTRSSSQSSDEDSTAGAIDPAGVGAITSLLAAPNLAAAFHVTNHGVRHLVSNLRLPTSSPISHRFQFTSMSEGLTQGKGAARKTETAALLKDTRVTDELLDNLFGGGSSFKNGHEEKKPADAAHLHEDIDEEALQREVQVFEWAEEDFQKEYKKFMSEQKDKLAAEATAAEVGDEDTTTEKAEDFDKSEIGTVKESEFITSVVQAKKFTDTKDKAPLHSEVPGSIQVHIASLTKKIAYLTTHVQKEKKDFSSLRGLQRMVNKRRKLLEYLLEHDRAEFNRVTSKFGIRTTKLLIPELQGARRLQQTARDDGTVKARFITGSQNIQRVSVNRYQ